MDDAITVTKGNLTDEELGALVAVVAELTRPGPNAYVPDAVSYTHLTLPTIYSV